MQSGSFSTWIDTPYAAAQATLTNIIAASGCAKPKPAAEATSTGATSVANATRATRIATADAGTATTSAAGASPMARQQGNRVANGGGAGPRTPSNVSIVACLQGLATDVLFNLGQQQAADGYGPTVDGVELTKHPWQLARDGEAGCA